MIPVALPGGNFYPMLAASLICLATLLTWVAVLCTTRAARMRVREHPRKSLAAMGMLALVGVIFPAGQTSRWLAAREAAQDEAAHTMVLDTAQELGGIAMPPGTRLRLRVAGQAPSFVMARFPGVATVGGARVIQVTRYLQDAGHDNYSVTGASATIVQDQAIDGWRCGRGHKVEFRTSAADDKLHFSSCHLATGNAVDGHAIPAGTWVTQRGGAVPATDPRMTEGWLLRTDGSEAVMVHNMPLLKADLRLDPQRHLVSFEGTLGKEVTLGPMTYPTGTRVGSAGATLAGAQADDLIFSPSRGRSARREGGEDVAAGNSVLQGQDGNVRSVMPNRAAGVLDFASIGLTP